MELEVGQILWLKIKYQADIISKISHPILVAIINIEDNNIEVIAIDKVKGKEYQLLNEANFYINNNEPKEKVIYMDSYAQLNNCLIIEYFPELTKYRKTKEKLSENKLNELLKEYKNYHNNNIIPDERIVYMTKEEILKWNK